jgi:hypothetical protein
MEKQLALVKGLPYLVKIRPSKGKKSLRVLRIYKGEETGILKIKRFVFTSKVPRGAYAIVKETKNTISFEYKNFGGKFPAQEISIPYYDLISVQPAPITQ